jgi:nicotinate-nucleotide pyrophosphorylase (carboxylating)
MLDNFDDDALRRPSRQDRRKTPPLIEVSGGVTLESIPKIAAAGVDIISVGGLTHSAPAVDFALDWVV